MKMKHLQLIAFGVVALSLVVGTDMVHHNGTKHTRVVKTKHTKLPAIQGNRGLIRGVGDRVQNIGNRVIRGAQNATKDLGPVGEIVNTAGNVAMRTLNGADSVISDVNNVAASAARKAAKGAKNLAIKVDSGVDNLIHKLH